ncbi:hypothetical protein ACS0TY_031381 [Phlomoides rotata]
MDQFQYPEIRRNQSKHKKRLTQDQVRLLESNFSFSNKLEPDRKTQLASELGIPPRQIAIWYQNKRARDKIQGIEVEHRALQQRLEDVLVDNARLKDEVDRLKFELNRVRGSFNSFNSSSSGDHEVGNSNLERELYTSYAGPFVPANDGYDFFG